jgi:hypothetical protein
MPTKPPIPPAWKWPWASWSLLPLPPSSGLSYENLHHRKLFCARHQFDHHILYHAPALPLYHPLQHYKEVKMLGPILLVIFGILLLAYGISQIFLTHFEIMGKIAKNQAWAIGALYTFLVGFSIPVGFTSILLGITLGVLIHLGKLT